MEMTNQWFNSFYIFNIFTICPYRYSCGKKIAKNHQKLDYVFQKKWNWKWLDVKLF